MMEELFDKVVRHCRQHCEHATDRDCWIAYLTGYYAQAHFNANTFTRVIPAGGDMGITEEATTSGVFNFRDCIDTGYWPCIRMISYFQIVPLADPPVTQPFFASLIDPRWLADRTRPPCGEVILNANVEAGPVDAFGIGQAVLGWTTRCKRLIPKQSGRFWELMITTPGGIPGPGEDVSDACVTVVWDEVPVVPQIPRCGSDNCV